MNTVDKTVERIVSVPCKLKVVTKPEFPADGLRKDMGLDQQVKAAVADIERRKSYEKELEGEGRTCQ